MPEILEVERYRALAEHALGRSITRLWMVDGRFGRGGTTVRRLNDALAGCSFTVARRRGKLLMLDSTAGPTLGMRFGMTGGLVVDGCQALDRLRYGPSAFDQKWVRARIEFHDGGSLELHDPRRFGSLELSPDESRLGPDALTATRAELVAALTARPPRDRTAPLKVRVMDQRRLAGLGNLLADEVLWRAGLDPGRRTALADAELRRLHTTMRSTLRELDRRGGSHTGDLMEQRQGDGHCPLDGAALRHGLVGGRSTYWCSLHQH